VIAGGGEGEGGRGGGGGGGGGEAQRRRRRNTAAATAVVKALQFCIHNGYIPFLRHGRVIPTAQSRIQFTFSMPRCDGGC